MNTIEGQQTGMFRRHRPASRTWLEEAKAELTEYFEEVRGLTEHLCDPLEIEDYVIQSMPDASPTKWHLAHTSRFFDMFVLRPYRPEHRVNPHCAGLFSSYYDSAAAMHCRPRRRMVSRPTVEEAYRYREQIDEQVLDLIAAASEELWAKIEPLLILGLNHEQQHQELILADLKHLFAENPLHPVYRKSRLTLEGNVPDLEWIGFPERLSEIGHGGDGFAFANERPRHREFLQGFQLASRLVTNGEFLEFMEDGGYERPELWLSLGWSAVKENGWDSPLYWTKQNGQWRAYTLSGMRPVELSEPVCHVSFFEADAFARWTGARLPTEAEWETVAGAVSVRGNFVEEEYYHPRPLVSGEAATGVAQLFGDVWEWTRSAYSPYPGHRPTPGAVDEEDSKFMCNEFVLRGGSCASPQRHLRCSYRNHFPPAKRWQFAGIRLAREVA